MKRFIEEASRTQVSLLPECLDDFVAEENPIRVVEAFVEQLDLATLEFDGVVPAVTGRPSYPPAVLLKIYIYGYLNRIQSSRRIRQRLLKLFGIIKAIIIGRFLIRRASCQRRFSRWLLPVRAKAGHPPTWRRWHRTRSHRLSATAPGKRSHPAAPPPGCVSRSRHGASHRWHAASAPSTPPPRS